MASTFLEPGTDATQDLSFFSSTSGTVASATDQSFTGPRSLKCSTGSPATTAQANRTGVCADAGRRISFRLRVSTVAPSASLAIMNIMQSDLVGINYALQLRTDGKLNNQPIGATLAVGTTVLSANAWYRIAVSYKVTNSTTFSFKVYVDGVLDSTATAGTMSSVTTNALVLRTVSGLGANFNAWYDDIYVDDGSDGSDPGSTNSNAQKVTSKRANANGTATNFTTQIGSGGSGYGTGHSPQVNEQPLSTTNGWSMVGAGSAVTEEYNVEGVTVGDADLTGATIIDVGGWVYASSLASETGQMVLVGATSNIALTSANTMFRAYAASTSYPPGTGTDIGIVTSTTLTTVSLYECGILIAYTPGAAATATTGNFTLMGVM